MLPFIGTYTEYSQVYTDELPSIDTIQDFFHQYKTSHIIQLVCKINIALWKVHNNYQDTSELQNHLIRMFFSDEEVEMLKKASLKDKNKSYNLIFHRHQALLAIKMILLQPNEEGKVINDFHEFGKYFLAISQHLHSDPKFIQGRFDSQDFEFTRKEIARLNYFSHYGVFVNNFSRAIIQWLEIPKTVKGKAFSKEISFNLENEFLDETELSIEEYLNLNFLHLGRLFKLNYKTENPEDFMIPANYLSLTQLSDDKKKLLLDSIVQNLGEYKINKDLYKKNKFDKKEIFVNDFLSIIDKPVIKISETRLIVTDPEFFEEKIENGPYWILLNRFFRLEGPESKKAGDLSKYFGLLHQEYIYQTLLNICDEVIEVKVRGNEQIKTCDFIGVIKQGEDIYLIVLDAKKIALGMDILLFSERDDTISNLKRVFGEKGFGQVYKTIEMITKGTLEEVKHIPLKSVKVIFPLVITDRFIAEETLNRKLYEDEFFTPLLAQYRLPNEPILANPIFLSSEELELMESAQKNNSDLSMLQFISYRHNALNKRYYKAQKQILSGLILSDLGWLVENLSIVWNDLYLLGYSKFENERLKKVFDKYFTELKKKLFGTTNSSVN